MEGNMRSTSRRGWRIAGGAIGAAALVGLGHVATSWIRYGRVRRRQTPPTLLDRFLPTYEVIEQHHTTVAAPVEMTYAAARAMDLMSSAAVRAIFRGRELLMRAKPTEHHGPQPLIDEVLSLGWGVLALDPGREMVLGAVTQPWEAHVRFHSLPPNEFATFDTPGFAKIAWTIRAEPLGPTTSRFYTETRVATTDPEARRLFRRYWAMVSPGVRLIRRESLRLVRVDAERRYQAQRSSGHEPAGAHAPTRA
jgi:hypothetical protein